MILDVIGIILLLLFFIRGYRKGIIVALFSVLGVILGMICALKLSNTLAAYLFEKGWVTSAWAQVLSYIVLFIGVIWLVRLGAKLIEKSIELVMLGIINRITGGLLFAFIAAFVWSCCLWIADQVHMIAPETRAASHTYSLFSPVAPWVFAHIGAVLPFAKGLLTDLKHFFDGVNQHLPDHVGAD
jgi:membrane protein required for colicin V production